MTGKCEAVLWFVPQRHACVGWYQFKDGYKWFVVDYGFDSW